jgi:YVTN family beta-propeller protein
LLADPAAHLLYLTHGTRVEVVNTQTGKSPGAITGLKGTHGIALDPDGKTGYISDGAANAVIVFDRKTFAQLASIPAGMNPDGIFYEPFTKTVWAFNGRSKNVTVIDSKTRTVTATIELPGKPEFPQVDGKGHVFDNIERTRTPSSAWTRSRRSTPTPGRWPAANRLRDWRSTSSIPSLRCVRRQEDGRCGFQHGQSDRHAIYR